MTYLIEYLENGFSVNNSDSHREIGKYSYSHVLRFLTNRCRFTLVFIFLPCGGFVLIVTDFNVLLTPAATTG